MRFCSHFIRTCCSSPSKTLTFAATLMGLGAWSSSALAEPPRGVTTSEDPSLRRDHEPRSSAPTESEKDLGETNTDERPTLGLWGRPVRRGGFHFQLGFGVGGGPDSAGLFHTMEVGYTVKQTTFGILHTFIQNKGMLGGTYGGPDLFGGWMIEAKHPLFFPDLVGKVAFGLGGIHEQPEGGPLKAHPGFGASYGVDLHFPIWHRFGPTLTVAALHATALGEHHFGVGAALGFTLF